MRTGRVIIADDFGLGRRHDSVILDLLAQGAIDGTSVFAMAPLDDRHVKRLLELRAARGIEIGLHLNLTDVIGVKDTRRSIVKLWLLSMISPRIRQIAKTEFTRQIAAFEAVFGIAPEYVDGHQHCHAIPAFWPALLPLGQTVGWVRSPCAKSLAGAMTQIRNGGVKSVLVMLWGARLRRRLRRAGFQTNADFSGLIAYRAADGYGAVFGAMIKAADCLTMVHPGDANDPISIDGHDNRFRAIEADILRNL